jgi:hypothetical protein
MTTLPPKQTIDLSQRPLATLNVSSSISVLNHSRALSAKNEYCRPYAAGVVGLIRMQSDLIARRGEDQLGWSATT